MRFRLTEILAAAIFLTAASNAQEKATFVIIEHNMEFVMSLCTRVIVLAEGKILAEGPPAEVRADPRVVDAYLGH